MSTPADRPQVAVNFALTWDGRISTRNYTPSDFSSPRDKRRLLEIRATGDAILAGVATIAADHMTMGLPAEDLRKERLARGQAEYPVRVLLSRSGQIDPALKVFQHAFSPIHIFSTENMPAQVRNALAGVATLHLAQSGEVDLAGMLRLLRSELGIERVVCEGGGQVFRSLLTLGLVDEINLTFCPRIFGSEQAPTLTGPAGEYLPQSVECRLEALEVIGGEAFARYRVGPALKGEPSL